MNQAAEDMVRFGAFELNLSTLELRKFDIRIRLRPQACRVLAMLASRAGQLVTRQELRHELWGEKTFVDFEHGINFCVRQIRRALGEHAASPHYIETVPGSGYRFTGASTSAIHSLAVLPFENAAADPTLEYLSDGITESLIRQIALVPKLFVMARSTVFRFKTRKTNVLAVGRRLGVGAVVTGRVLQREGRLLISADLVDVTTGFQLWGEQYNRSAADLLAVQQEISAEIAGKLRMRLSSEDRDRVKNWGTQDTDAYHLYLRGRYHANKWSGEGFHKGVEYFKQAIDKDPAYALAYAGIADCYGPLGFYGYVPPTDSWPKSKSAAVKALEIDNGLAEAHVSLAAVELFYNWDPSRAHLQCRHAIELNPSYPLAHAYDAGSLIALGRCNDAVAEIAKAQSLDPLSAWAQTFSGVVLYFARQYDRAVIEFNKALELDSRYGEAQRFRGITYLQVGRNQTAITDLEAARALLGDTPAALGSLGRAYARSGFTDRAEGILMQLQSIAARKRVAAASIAAVHVGLGHEDLALDWLERAVKNRSSWLVWLSAEPWWDPLRQSARFLTLSRQITSGESGHGPLPGVARD